jgi:hypothetical protein
MNEEKITKFCSRVNDIHAQVKKTREDALSLATEVAEFGRALLNEPSHAQNDILIATLRQLEKKLTQLAALPLPPLLEVRT